MQSEPLDSFMDYVPMPIGILDKRLRFVKVNQAMAEVHQLSVEEHTGKAVAEVIPSVAKLIRPILSRVLTTGKPAVAPISGDLPPYSSTSQNWLAACFPCGESKIALVALRATERGLKETLARSTRRLKTTLSDLQQVLLANEMTHALHAAATTEELYKVVERFGPRLFPGDSGSLLVMDPVENVIEKHAAWGGQATGKLISSPDACFALREGREHLVRNPQSSQVCAHARDGHYAQVCVPMMVQSARLGVLHLCGRAYPAPPFTPSELRLARIVAAEIALSLANIRLRESLQLRAFRDPLTGLYNRRFLHEALNLELRRAKRKGWTVGLVMIDVDNFKSFNDTYGHAAGDSLLQKVATCLQASVRSNDVLCRYGGDEFSLIMPEASLQDIVQWACRRKATAQFMSFEWDGEKLPFPTLSMGLAAYPACRTADELFRQADAALYAAKADGRDQLKSH